jgi:N4-(beta-N-acetylglucosaminyl)-L-asparaginase
MDRRHFLSAAASTAAFACNSAGTASANAAAPLQSGRKDWPTLVGSANGLRGMKEHYAALEGGADPLDVAISVVKVQEADPGDSSVGYGGLPNEDGVVQLDAACMYGPTHNSGSVAAIENIMHPSEVARLVMERTDHCMIVGRGAYEFARMHGHEHVELLTEKARQSWLKWKESMSDRDDRLAPPKDERSGRADAGGGADALAGTYEEEFERHWGTIHCSALSVRGEIACTTTTSGLSWKIPGRIGDSPIIGAGLYCDQEAGSAGSTGRGEAAILSNGSSMIVELMRQGAAPVDAGLEVLRRIVRQVERQSKWQPALMNAEGKPSFGINFYVLGMDGKWAGVTLKKGGKFAVADPEGGPRHETMVGLL